MQSPEVQEMLQSPEAMAQLGINPEMLQVCMHAYAIAHARATCTGHMHMPHPHATRHMHMRACMHITCHTPHTHATRLMRMHMLHMQAMMGGLAGGGGGGGGMMQIEVTPEDEEAISRLMSLGFPRGAAIQARLVTMQCIMQRCSGCTESVLRCHAGSFSRAPLHYTLHCSPQAFMACDKDENLAANFLFDQGNDLE